MAKIAKMIPLRDLRRHFPFAVFFCAALFVPLFHRENAVHIDCIWPMECYAKRLRVSHPEWNIHPMDAHLRFLILAKPDREQSDCAVSSLLAYDSVERIRRHPFDPDVWKRIVFVRLYQNENGEKQGWYGPVLIKGRFLFYGDQEMLRQIEADAEVP